MITEIAEMSIRDYDEVVSFWNSVEGVGLNDADTRENMDSYLRRNPGLTFVARHDGQIVGAVLCGHDGRRGYLHHLAVAHTHRRQGLGKALVDKCLSGLRSLGIQKCNIMVFGGNEEGLAFWKADGWVVRDDLKFVQKWTDGRAVR